ncbi:MAG: hypothetical protein ACLR23_03585 [Clostridia bacterium]
MHRQVLRDGGGLPYVEFNKELLTVRNWIGGDEAELESLEDAMLVARQLGQMHTFCTGLDPMEGKPDIHALV